MGYLADNVWSHPKYVSLSDKAFRAWVNSVAYSSGYGLRGRLAPGHQKLVGGVGPIRRELIMKRAWDDPEDGTDDVLIHDWDEHNGKRDDRREKDRERKRASRASAGQSRGQSAGRSQGQSRAASTVAARVDGSEGSKPYEEEAKNASSSRELATVTHLPVTAQTLTAWFVDESKKLGGEAPSRVVGHVAKLCGELLAEGVQPDSVRAGLALLLEKRMHPSTLPSLVHEASLPRRSSRRGRVTPSELFAQAQQLRAREEAMFHDAG